MTVPLSILDLATIGPGQTAAESFAGSVAMAQRAEDRGYRRVWYAEHHNMSLDRLVGHERADRPRRRPHHARIRLGAGGIMLPNHAPLTIAEQFGTLETLHPGRIDLGLGRAPGSDQNTMRALRRDPMSADELPAGRPGAPGLPDRPHPHPGRGRHPGQGHQRAAVHPRFLAVRRQAGRRSSACRTRSPRTSRPTRCRTPSPSTAANSGRPRSSTPRT